MIRAATLTLFLLLSSGISGQEVKQIRVPELERILKNGEDKVFVVNFWATWCAPCVKEFPVFRETADEYSKDKVSFIMISLDFPSSYKQQLIPFLKKNNSTLDVSVMMDMDYESWIGLVDPSWNGTLPATLVFNNAKDMRQFHQGEITRSILQKMIDTNL